MPTLRCETAHRLFEDGSQCLPVPVKTIERDFVTGGDLRDFSGIRGVTCESRFQLPY